MKTSIIKFYSLYLTFNKLLVVLLFKKKQLKTQIENLIFPYVLSQELPHGLTC